MQGEYESPLVARIAEIRRGILHRAQEGNWIIDVAQLTDQAIIRRMVLKRCIYGVDKNRLTVELAKVSLWMHSFTERIEEMSDADVVEVHESATVFHDCRGDHRRSARVARLLVRGCSG